MRTNRDLLVEVLRHPRFLDEDLTTDFLDRHHLGTLTPRASEPDTVARAAFAAAVALAARAPRRVQAAIPAGWRNVVSTPQETRFELDGNDVLVQWYGGRDGFRSDAGLHGVVNADGSIGVVEGTVTSRFTVHVVGVRVDVESSLGHVSLRRTPRFVDPADQVASGSLLAPMPGTVVAVAVEVGAEVTAGAPVLVLEAMKMQHTVAAPHSGTVTEIPASVGDQVAAGDVVAVVSTSSTPEDLEEA